MNNPNISSKDMKKFKRELEKIKRKLPHKREDFNCLNPSWKAKGKSPHFLKTLLIGCIIVLVGVLILAIENSFWNWMVKKLTDNYLISYIMLFFLLLILSICLVKFFFENSREIVHKISQLIDFIFQYGFVISIMLFLVSLICVFSTKDSFCRMYCLFLYLFSILYVTMFAIYKIKALSNCMVIEEFNGPEAKPDKESRAVTRILTAELSRLRRLREVTNNKRIKTKQLLANYPSTHPPTFEAFNSDASIPQLQGDLKIGEITFPFNFFNFFNKLISRRITGAVSVINSRTKLITAELSNSMYTQKRKKVEFETQFIWETGSTKTFMRDSPHIANDDMEEQTKELAALIFSNINEMPIGSNTETIRHYTDGVQAYKDALQQPFRRRQLLHDAEQHFRKVISGKDNFFEAYYDLGIVYLELGLPDQAEKFFNIAIDKMTPESESVSIFYALADSVYNPVKGKYAAPMRKYWKLNVKKPFRNLTDPETYKKDLFSSAVKQKCYKVKALCDAVINKLQDYRSDLLCAKAYILRSTIEMYLGDDNSFLKDLFLGLQTAFITYLYHQSDPEFEKKPLIDVMLNFSMACTRNAVWRCSFDKNSLDDLSSYKENYNTALLATEIAELIDKGDSEIYYIRGRLQFYFSYYDKAIESYRTAYSLKPDNYNFLGNFAAACISKIQTNCDYNRNISDLEAAMERIYNCPSRIRHEVLEHIAEIPYKTKCDDNELSKKNCEKINDYILQAKILIIFSHKMDTVGEAACAMSIPEELNRQYRCMYESKIIDTLCTNQNNDWESNEFKNFFCTHLSEENKNLKKTIGDAINKYNKTGSKTESITDFKKELKIITCENRCGNPNNHCSMDIDDTQISRFNELMGKWALWIRAQVYAKIGRTLLFDSPDPKFKLAEYWFSKAVELLKGKGIEEIEFQRMYSFYGYARAHTYNHESGQKDLIDILEQLEKAFQNDSLDSFAHFAKGLLHLKCNNIIEAHESLFNALSLSPEPEWRPVNLWYEKEIEFHPPELYIYFAISSIRFVLLQGKKEVRLKILSESIQTLSYLLDVYVASSKTEIGAKKQELVSKAYYWLGVAYFIHGEFESALEKFKLCKLNLLKEDSKKEPNEYSILPDYWKAKCLYRLRKVDKAISEFTKLINTVESDKDNVDQMLRNEKEKLEILHDHIENADELIGSCFLYRACCYAGTEDFKKAERDLEFSELLIKQTDREEIKARLNIDKLSACGICCFHKKHFKEAIDCLKMALPHVHNSDIVYHLIVALLYHYCTLNSQIEIRACRITIEFILKVALEHCLEINSYDELSLPVEITENIFKVHSYDDKENSVDKTNENK